MWQIKRQIDKIIDKLKHTVLLQYNFLRKPSVVTIKGIKILVSESIDQRMYKILYSGAYENKEVKIIDSQIDKEDVVMEVGTGLGFIASYCAQKIGSNRVFTYEANPNLEKIICKTFELNNVSPNFKTLLLSDRHGEQDFYVTKKFWGSSTISKKNASKIRVPIEPFNEEVKNVNPSFLILDIEGGEYDLLKYADLHNIKKVAMELHGNFLDPEKVNFVKQQLRDLGFQLCRECSYFGKNGMGELFWKKHS